MAKIRIARLLGVIAALTLLIDIGVAVARKQALGMYSIPGYVRGDRDVVREKVIVFVHGFGGDGVGTWTNGTTGAYFPDLLRGDSVFDDTDIWVDDYRSACTRSYSVDEIADHLHRRLDDDNVIRNHRQIIFVAHSMGGLVVRAYLLKYRDKLPAERVPMLYFFATPSSGAELANIAKVFCRNGSIPDMAKMKTGRSGVLGMLSSQWVNSPYTRATRSYCAYEVPKSSDFVVVQRESAQQFCNSTVSGIDTNHVDIVKPSDQRDESYVALRSAFRETFADAIAAQSPKWNIKGGRPSLIRLSKDHADLACGSCWLSDLEIRPLDRVFVAAHYENYGATAKDVRLHLDVPNTATSAQLIGGKLSAAGASPFESFACIAPPRAPVLLFLVQAYWYPHNSKTWIPLPDGQSMKKVLSPGGLTLGEVSAGQEFASDVVFEFESVGVTLMAVRDVEPLIDRVAPSISENRRVDLSEISEILASTIKVSEGATDFADSSEARGWVSHLKDLWRNELIVLCVFVHNEFPQRLHDARLFIDVTSSDAGDPMLRVVVRTRETSWEVARTPITFATGASSLKYRTGFDWPYGLCPTKTASLKEIDERTLYGDPVAGLKLGDLAPESDAIYAIAFDIR